MSRIRKPAGFVEGPPAGEVFHAAKISDRDMQVPAADSFFRHQPLKESRWKSAPAGPLRIVRQWDIPISCDIQDLPLIVALGKILQPHDLVCDYRYGMLWIAEREEAEQWQDRTGIDQIVPPAGTLLAKNWESNSLGEFIETPLRRAFEISVTNHVPTATFDWSRVPAEHQDGRAPGSTITINVEHIPLKYVLGVILDHAGCRMRLEGETLVVELQPERPATNP